MSKINELILKSVKISGTTSSNEQIWTSDAIREIMEEYAEWYAKECLEIAAEQAETEWGTGCDYDVKVVDKSSILNIKLPPHE